MIVGIADSVGVEYRKWEEDFLSCVSGFFFEYLKIERVIGEREKKEGRKKMNVR
jgi:hypothetical protein